MDAVSNKINTNLIGLVNQDKKLDFSIKSDFSIMGLERNLNLNSIAQQQISNYPKVIVYFLPNSASIANTCSLMSL